MHSQRNPMLHITFEFLSYISDDLTYICIYIHTHNEKPLFFVLFYYDEYVHIKNTYIILSIIIYVLAEGSRQIDQID